VLLIYVSLLIAAGASSFGLIQNEPKDQDAKKLHRTVPQHGLAFASEPPLARLVAQAFNLAGRPNHLTAHNLFRGSIGNVVVTTAPAKLQHFHSNRTRLRAFFLVHFSLVAKEKEHPHPLIAINHSTLPNEKRILRDEN
jgi:hypothetical protein